MAKVIEKILEKCRRAMLSSVPVIFVKTDSDLLIQRLVGEKEKPLVTLRYKPEMNAPDKELAGRPVSDKNMGEKWRLFDKDCRVSNYGNFLVKNGYGGNFESTNQFSADSNGKYHSALTLTSFLEKLDYPAIITIKISQIDDWNPSAIESYVRMHEDKSYKNYAILQSSALILYSSFLPENYTEMLRTYTEIIDVDVPSRAELKGVVSGIMDTSLSIFEESRFTNMLEAEMQGFTLEEAETTMRRINAAVALEKNIAQDLQSDEADKIRKQIFDAAKAVIADRKRQKTEGSTLELCQTNGSIGGMEELREWLDNMRDPIKNYDAYSRFLGLRPPKGILLCGIPGCGKSEAAKFTASTLQMPLLKMDIGSLMDKFQGKSEQKMRQALRTAEMVSPCVLWIDELEKGFSAAKASSDDDSGTFKRMFAYMLNWMQENTSPVFVFATANNISGLPKEFFRSGRFDALFGVYLPTENECVEIFRKSMERCEKAVAERNKNIHKLFALRCFDSELIKEVLHEKLVCNDYPRIVIGSDIQNIVNIALRSFMSEKYITIDHNSWKRNLKKACDEATVYGDGSENIESIAVSYCRMLRKGIMPTTNREEVLFSCNDYHGDNIEKLDMVEMEYNRRRGEMTEKEYQSRKAQHRILTENNRGKHFDTYDKAVYKMLFKKINEVAEKVERFEKESIIRG